MIPSDGWTLVVPRGWLAPAAFWLRSVSDGQGRLVCLAYPCPVVLSVLGPLRLVGSAGPVAVPGRKAREVLALLALAAPRPLSVGALAERLWDDPPPAAVKTVRATCPGYGRRWPPCTARRAP